MKVSRKVVKTTRASGRSCGSGAEEAPVAGPAGDEGVSFTVRRKPLRKTAEAFRLKLTGDYFFDQVAPPSEPTESLAWPEARHALLASEIS